MQFIPEKERNGTGQLASIKTILELLVKAPRNDGYFRKFLAEIDRLSQQRASLILQQRLDESDAIRDTLIALAEDPRYRPFFDRKKALDALRKYQSTVQNAESRTRVGRRS